MQLVLFCKTFRGDADRLPRLVASLERYNKDLLPLVISAPRADHQIIMSVIGAHRVLLLADEDILRRYVTSPGWYEQQVVKLSFALTGIAENYVIIDSDHYMVRKFGRSDFVADNGNPYLIVSAFPFVAQYDVAVDARNAALVDEMMAALAAGEKIGARGSIADVLDETRGPDASTIRLSREMIEPGVPPEMLVDKAQELMQRPGPQLHFMHGPIWSAAVVRALKEQLLDPSGIDFRTMIRICPWEANWYGNWVLSSRCIEVVPKVPMFIHFSTDESIIRAREAGITNQLLARSFIGVALAARHQDLLSVDVEQERPQRSASRRRPVAGKVEALPEP